MIKETIMSNNLPNSNNDGANKNSGSGGSSGNPPSPIEPVRQDVKQKVDKILNK